MDAHRHLCQPELLFPGCLASVLISSRQSPRPQLGAFGRSVVLQSDSLAVSRTEPQPVNCTTRSLVAISAATSRQAPTIAAVICRPSVRCTSFRSTVSLPFRARTALTVTNSSNTLYFLPSLATTDERPYRGELAPVQAPNTEHRSHPLRLLTEGARQCTRIYDQ